MDTIISLFVFFLGAIIGSFLNVVILRYRSGRTLGGRSGCFTCGKTLTWTELIPIGSFLTQKGKCAGCHTKISWQYPIVEALTGLLFVFLYYRLSYLLPDNGLLFGVLFMYYATVIAVLMVLSVYDVRHKILPDGLNILFASITCIGMFLLRGDSVVLHLPTFTHFVAGIILPAPFVLLWIVSKGEWMGLGDSKLMIGIGFLLGFSGGVTAILLAFWIGAFVSLVLLFITRILKSKKHLSLATAIPFGPFLAIGTILVVLMQWDFTTILSVFARI